MKELKGAQVVAALNADLIKRVEGLKNKGIKPTLAIIRIGDRSDDVAYEKGATKRCETIGVSVKKLVMDKNTSQESLIRTIHEVNQDEEIHGVLLFRPLPDHMDEEMVCNALKPEKDVDGITAGSMAGVFMNSDLGFAPCTAQACMELLDYYDIDLTGKKVAVLGRSLVVGKPVAMMLMQKNATVTICHSKTKDLREQCRESDVIIAAMGRAKMIDEGYLAKGQIVLDVGINMDENGKMCGDVNFSDAISIVDAVTPVPGGIGTVTTSVLVKHVVEAAEHSARISNPF